AAGTAALCGAGALLAAGALALHAAPAHATFAQLADVWSGRLAVALLGLALVPNAAVWGAAYGLGPGFALGAGSPVGPWETGEDPSGPAFPLLAGVPPQGPGSVWGWAAVAAVPLAGALAAAWPAARAVVPVRGQRSTATGRTGTALLVLLAACGTGLAMAVLASLAGGPLGTGELARFGPSGYLTGAAAAGWTALLGVPAALMMRAWRLRSATDPDDHWHATGARRVRWARLKESSGGLMPDFPPEPAPAPGDGPGAPGERVSRPPG
ncbi:cell division protein PerM, partial [Streptomyces sodiiphilus]|uniref:cell division protein PerM n=1 Tax=Streptomyces sodiiphilus TaxID=226217 RepID=UPI0031D34526